MTCGIYLIKNKLTNQIYIGQSINIERRWKQHINSNDFGHSYIDNAIQKYGKDNFVLQIITKLPNNQFLLDEHEKYWIKFYNAYTNKNNYNLTPGGDFSPMRSEEIRKKHRESVRNKNNTKQRNSKYTLWDSSKTQYSISNMFRDNTKLNPRKCFHLKYCGKIINIGGFNDFVSCEIIYNLIEKSIV